MKKNMKKFPKTITEVLNEEITVLCYLCGKGEITLRRGDLGLRIPSHIDSKIRQGLESFLLKKAKEFLNLSLEQALKITE